jgi:dynein heavy chain
MRNAVDTTRLIMDTIHVLFMRPLDPVKPRSLKILKQDNPFMNDSFDLHTKVTLSNANFLKDLFDFSNNQKDNINEETIELLEPYLLFKTADGERDIYTAVVAKQSSSALEGLCTWCAAMSDYHKASKIVKPKLRLLEIKAGELQEAQDALTSAEGELAEVTALKERLKKRYDDAMDKKNILEENA